MSYHYITVRKRIYGIACNQAQRNIVDRSLLNKNDYIGDMFLMWLGGKQGFQKSLPVIYSFNLQKLKENIDILLHKGGSLGTY